MYLQDYSFAKIKGSSTQFRKNISKRDGRFIYPQMKLNMAYALISLGIR